MLQYIVHTLKAKETLQLLASPCVQVTHDDACVVTTTQHKLMFEERKLTENSRPKNGPRLARKRMELL
jgi:hypothetical protein